ncbi:lactonase family protein [Arthrobacter sp. NIO-1057]|uniref:lactonase family protein n=1 Tax=Arthrobacter sp. NIO-1057 TaxID=993071 RepID=UPI0008180748|nr:beta-propeller fold lactonase family protein [Arthrobacter sp. NIO-1057]SCC29011.1 Lactonase, 7-bladed beta-propeller [Arthrobacter sp. NIO-1057]
MNDDLVLVGSRTTKERNARGEGLTLWDASKPEWQLLDTLPMTNPSWITAGAGSTYYVLHGDGAEVSTVEISAERKILRRQTIDCLGLNPVHAAVKDDSRLIIANYATGTVAAFNIDSAGNLQSNGNVINLGNLYAKQFVDEESRDSHPHQILILPERNGILVPDKGLDALFVIDIADGGLHAVDIIRTAPGSGPRHAAISPNRSDSLYVVGELNSTLMHFLIGPNCTLDFQSSYSTLPREHTGDDSSAAGIVVDDTRVFVSNRGHDSIAVFDLDMGGTPVKCSIAEAGGAFPRFITLRSDALVIAHENGDTIAKATLDTVSGLPSPQVIARTGSPVCVQTVG